MTIKISGVTKEEADKILRYVWEADKGAVYGPKETVYGSVVTAQWKPAACAVELQSNALNEATMKDYLPAQYR